MHFTYGQNIQKSLQVSVFQSQAIGLIGRMLHGGLKIN